jgi:hypothetical protein
MDGRFDFYAQRLAFASERIFSHIHTYAQPKLNADANAHLTTVYNLHSCLGRDKPIWVYGILTQKEDTYYYLEDSTYNIRVNFSECEMADPEAYFTENCVILCKGT